MSDEAFAYYYCHHSRSHDETTHFLRWTLNQLCRQADFIPRLICRRFQEDFEPGLDDLISGIQEVAKRFSRVTIAIDAVDESHNRHVLAKLLQRMASAEEFAEPEFRILVTSRVESDIQPCFVEFGQVSMSNPLVDADIRHYVEQQIIAEPKFRRWSDSFREEAVSHLALGARGM